MLVDIHAHTILYSDDSDLRLEELILHAKRWGLNGICLTEHDSFWKEEDIVGLSHKYDFAIFPGVEINTEHGHFLVFGLKQYEFGMHHTRFVRKRVDEVGGAIVLAHPYRGQVHQNPTPNTKLEQACKNTIFDIVDAVEILNSMSKDVENNFAYKLCSKLEFKTVGGSDAHALRIYLPAPLFLKVMSER